MQINAYNLLFFLDMAKMRQQMEEEIKAQLMANQEAMADMDWDTKVSVYINNPIHSV